jgi:hypothetical protein
LRTYLEATLSSLKEAALISGIDVVAALAILFIFQFAFLDVFGLILLGEAAGLMLVGGAVSFSGQPGVRHIASLVGIFGKKQESSSAPRGDLRITRTDVRAAFYIITGVVLFTESMALAFFV